MSEIAAAMGELAQGGLTARALEPSHGESDGHTHEAACLNCGSPLMGPHCHQCGQRGHVHRTLGAFFHDLLHGVLHFEGKTWRTLPLLAWRPGKLTREYIDGRRASYVSPIALFLFVVFLTFAGFHALGNAINFGDVSVNGKKLTSAEAQQQLGLQIAELRHKRGELVRRRQPTAGIDNEIAGLERAQQTVESIDKGDVGGFAKSIGSQEPNDQISVTSKLDSINSLWRKAKQNPDLMIYKLQSNAYKYSWLLIPISVPFVWLLFPFRRRFPLYDHTVFVTYSLSFMSLLLLIGAAGAKFALKPLVLAAVLYVPFHLYRQIHETYGTSRIGAVARTFVLLIFAAIAITLWGAAILALILGE